ncbi:Condensin complex subunit 2 [Dictyocoela muelleri]|nr:Condensin complex subunit 2 [Dictyocoela muelleri]
MNFVNLKKDQKLKSQNTWSSSVIDTFTTIPPKIDYYKTSCALNDCIKIYSTRVDELCANTNRMLKILEVKRKPKSQKETLESEEKLNLKEIPDFTDFFVKVKKLRSIGEKQDFLLNSAIQLFDCDLQLFQKYDQEPYFLENIEVDEYQTERFICPSLSKIAIEEERIIDPNETINNIDIELDNDLENIDNDENANKDDNCNYKPEFVNPFLNDWSVPSKWKLTRKGAKKKTKKEQKIDFNIQLRELKTGDTCLSHEEIRKRRKDLNILPDDYQYNIDDLFKFSVRDGFINAYKTFKKERIPVNVESPTLNTIPMNQNNDNMQDVHMNDVPINEINVNEINMNEIDTRDITKMNNLEEYLPNNSSKNDDDEKRNHLRKIQKRVDISKLKANIFSFIELGEKKFNDICKKIPQKYDSNEAKDISIQTCFISLLHLANEKNIFLMSKENELEIDV